MCGFFLIIYSICYHTFTCKFFNRRISSNALYLCKANMKGFVLELFIFGIRSLLNGFIHGFFLDHHELQICLLIGVAGFLNIVIITLRKSFLYPFSFALTLLYFIFYLFFNTLILLEIKGINFLSIPYENLDYYVLIILLALTLFRFLVEVVIMFKEMCKNNKSIDNFLRNLEA